MNKISVVIPIRITNKYFRDPGRLEYVLASYSWQTKLPYEVIVVDYGSKEQFAKKISSYASHFGFNYIYVESNIWNKCHAYNIGIRQAEEDFIFCAEADIILDLQYFEKLPYGKSTFTWTLFHSLDKQQTKRVFLQRLPEFREGFNDYYLNSKVKDVVAKANVCVSRKWLFKVRGFDERIIGWGGPDSDIYARAEADDLKMIEFQFPLLHLWHKTKKEFDDWSEIEKQWQKNISHRHEPPIRNKDIEWGMIK